MARGLDAMILDFWMLNFKPAFSLSSFTFIKKLFSSSSLSVIRMLSYAYLRLLIFLLAVLIPAWASSSLFHVMYSIYKLKISRVTSLFSNFLLITSFVVWLLENVIYSFIYTTFLLKLLRHLSMTSYVTSHYVSFVCLEGEFLISRLSSWICFH